MRFRMPDTPELPWDILEKMAARIAVYGWHVQFQMDGRYLEEREDLLKRLPGTLARCCSICCSRLGAGGEQPQPDTRDEPRRALWVSGWKKAAGVRMKGKRSVPMRTLIVVLAAVALAGCGVDTATTAATGAAIKKQEAEQGKRTQEQVQQKIDRAMDQTQQRARQDAGSDAR